MGRRGAFRRARAVVVFSLLLLACVAAPVLARSTDGGTVGSPKIGISEASALGASQPSGARDSELTQPPEPVQAEPASGTEEPAETGPVAEAPFELQREPALETSQAVAEREESQLAYAEITPAEEASLLKESFAPELQEISADPSGLLQAAKLDQDAAIAGVMSCLLLGSCGSGGFATGGEDLNPRSPLAQPGKERRRPIPKLGQASAPALGELAAVPWRLLRIAGGRAIEIGSAKGYCVGAEPPPSYEAVRVVEHGGRAEITTFVGRANPLPPGGICSGVGYREYGMVKLDSPIAALRLYDGATQPLQVRWPRTHAGNGG